MLETRVRIPIVVRFGDTDPYGVVYFVSYFRYCHWGIEEFLRHLGLKPGDIFRNREKKFGLPVVGAKCDFFKPIWYGQSLELEVSVKSIKAKVIVFNFDFFKPQDQTLVAKGEATLVAIGADWKSRELPEMLIGKLH